MSAYVAGIWSSRHFWWHLARADLRWRWRRSFLGPLWSLLQPLGMTALLAVVLGRLLHADVAAYAPYILSGIVVWDCISACCLGGSLAFVQADAYIKQCRHPLAIYTLRTVLSALMLLAAAMLPLLAWSAWVHPERVGICWLAALAIFPALLLVGWPIATVLAYIATRFRDLPHALGLALQAVWFVSPVYFEPRLFRDGGLAFLVDANPIYHLLQLLRAPLLAGAWPTAGDGAAVLALAAGLWLLALVVGWRCERRMIFYL